MNSTICQSNPIAVAPIVLKTFDSFIQFLSQDSCLTYTNPKLINSVRSSVNMQVPNNDLCTLPWKDQLGFGLQQTNKTSIAFNILSLVQASFLYATTDLMIFELKKYGRNPGGLTYEKVANEYIPTKYDANGVPDYTVSKSFDCTYASFLAVDEQTRKFFDLLFIALLHRITII